MNRSTELSHVYNLFFNPGEVTEIRAYGLSGKNEAWEGWAGGSGVVFGYFDNAEAFGRSAGSLEEKKAPGIYFTLNPVIPDLLARAANRLKAADGKTSSTSDKDILCVRWLPIDLDPVRPSGISSTNEELALAVNLRERIAEWVEKELMFPPGIKAISGNGAHLLYRLPDLPIQNRQNISEDFAVKTIKDCLQAIQEKFNDNQVEIDQKVFNPSRIWKLYGTTARKGDWVPTRPHRKSCIEEAS